MEALDCVSHWPTLVSQASHPSHDRGPIASLETLTDAARVELRSAGHGAGSGYDCFKLPQHLRSGILAGLRPFKLIRPLHWLWHPEL